jgi:hypothetical protein
MKRPMRFAALALVMCAGMMAALFSNLTPLSPPFRLYELMVILALIVIFFWPVRSNR